MINHQSAYIAILLLIFPSIVLAETFNLSWNLKNTDKIMYSMSKSSCSLCENKVEDFPTYNSFELRNNKQKLYQLLETLKGLSISYNYELALYKPSEKLFEAKLNYLTPNDWQKLLGPTRMFVRFDEKGQTPFFFLSKYQRTLSHLLFDLPKDKVAVQQKWDFPVSMIQGLAAITEQNANAFGYAWIDKVSQNIKKQYIAHIIYLSGEHLAGTLHLPSSQQELKNSSNLLGYGEFLIDQGYWQTLRFVNYSDINIGEDSTESFHVWSLSLQ